MMDDGLLDDPRPDAAFALHIAPNVPKGKIVSRPGPLLASADTLSATIRGKGGHAAMPHDCLDPVPVAAEIVLALQSWVARQVAVTDPAVLTIAQINAGATSNVIPSSVEMHGTLRTLSERTRAMAQAAFVRIVEHVAAAHGLVGEAKVEAGYPVTMNDPRAVELMRDCAVHLAGPEAWSAMPAAQMGAEDFAFVLQEIPGAMSLLSVGAPGANPRGNPPLHNSRMTLDEGAMAAGVALHCAVAERFLAGGLNSTPTSAAGG